MATPTSSNSSAGAFADRVTLDKSSITIGVGKTTALRATISPKNVLNATVEWTSSNKEVATVYNGNVLGQSSGTATIYAKTDNGKQAACKVKVQTAAESSSVSSLSSQLISTASSSSKVSTSKITAPVSSSTSISKTSSKSSTSSTKASSTSGNTKTSSTATSSYPPKPTKAGDQYKTIGNNVLDLDPLACCMQIQVYTADEDKILTAEGIGASGRVLT